MRRPLCTDRVAATRASTDASSGHFHLAALAYAASFGWRVVPCKPHGRNPLTDRGWLDGTTNPRQIDAWWRDAPEANVGVVCDVRSGLLALEIDPRGGGNDSLAWLEWQHSKLPDTAEVLARNGQRAMLLRRPVGVFRRQLGPGLTLVSAGHILAPPSVDASGRPCAWGPSSRPGEIDLAWPPAWFTRFGRPTNAGGGAARKLTCADSILARIFEEAGWTRGKLDCDRVAVRCPWEHAHTVAGGKNATVILAPRTESEFGRFCCSHPECRGRTRDEVFAALPYESVSEITISDLARQLHPDDGERLAIQMEGRGP